MISPKLVEVGRHLNIELLTNTELEELSGEAGHFTATVNQKARYVDISKCTSCGECIDVCPIEVPNEYDKGLSKTFKNNRTRWDNASTAVAPLIAIIFL